MLGMRLAAHAIVALGLMAAAGSAQVRTANAPAPASGSYLGVWIWEIDGARAKELRLPEPGGLEVTRVSPGSPADLAGMVLGDVVTEYDSEKVEGIEQFQKLVAKTPVGRSVKLRIVRNGSSQMLTAKIGYIAVADRPAPMASRDLPASMGRQQDVPRSLTTWRSPLLGVDSEPLFGQLAAFFGVTEGVLIRSVAAATPAERAGLKAGDVVVRVGKFAVATPADVTARLRALTGAMTLLTVMRERKEVTLTVNLEQR